MNEQRLIDANLLLKEAEGSLCENPHTGVMAQAMHTHEHMYFMCMILHQTAIDPETLPVVQQLRTELERVTAERDAAVNDCSGRCETCAFESDCAKHDNNDTSAGMTWHCDCEEWEWRGLQKVDCKKEGDPDESAQETAGERIP